MRLSPSAVKPRRNCYNRAALARTKEPVIDVDGVSYLRVPIKTHVLTEEDDAVEVVRRYAVPQSCPDDVLFIAETGLAIMQGRQRHIDTIHVSMFAKVLSRLVTKSPYGVGLRSPRAMQVAIEEVGAWNVLKGALAAAWGKLVLRRRGDFYEVAGLATKMIDAEHTMGIKKYWDYVIPGPVRIPETCRAIKEVTGLDACVVDVNDIQEPWVIGASFGDELARIVARALKDNPLGQGDECTPMGLLRRAGPS